MIGLIDRHNFRNGTAILCAEAHLPVFLALDFVWICEKG